MKGKNKVILGSALAIAMSASMIAGSTLALFTSESTVNIAVTSGKVNVTASLDDLQTKSLTDVSYTETTKAFGGSATIKDSSLTIENFAAGDGVKFNIDIANESTIDVKYRLTMSTNMGKEVGKTQALSLARMNITMDGKTVIGNTVVTEWQSLEKTTEIPVTVEIDKNANEEAQGRTITLYFTVEAVQGNGVENTVIASAEDLVAFAADVNAGNDYEGKIVTLAEDIDMAGVQTAPIGTRSNLFRGIFDGKGHKISNLTIEENTDGVGLFGYIHGDAVLRDFTLVNANVKGVDYVGGVAGKVMLSSPAVSDFAQTQSFIQNVNVVDSTVEGGHWVGGVAGHSFGIIRNCTVTGGSVKAVPYFVSSNGMDNGDKVGGLVGMQQDASLIGNKVSGTKIEGVRDLGVIAGHISITNNNVFVTEFSDNIGENATVTRGVYAELPIAEKDRNLGEICGRKPTTICKDGGAAVQNSIFYGMAFADIFDNYRTHNNSFTGTTYGEVNCDAIDNSIVYIPELSKLQKLAEEVNKGTSYEGKTIVLGADIDLAGSEWTPIGTSADNGFKGTFDGNGHTISNFTVTNNKYAGLFGYIYGEAGSTVKNLTVKNAVLESMHHAGVIVGHAENGTNASCTIENCHVYNCRVTTVPELMSNGTYDNGDKAGALAGFFGENGIATNCSATDCVITGYRDIGGLFGNSRTVAITNCTANNVTIVLQEYEGTFAGTTSGSTAQLCYGAIVGRLTVSGTNAKDVLSKAATNVATDCKFIRLDLEGNSVLENALTADEYYEAVYKTVVA